MLRIIVRYRKILIIAALLLIYSAGLGYAGVKFQRSGLANKTTLHKIVSYFNLSHFLEGLAAKPEKISLEISAEALATLQKNRDQAIATGLIFTSTIDEVPVIVNYNEKKMEAKARLKGDLTDHIREDKWSLKITLKGDNRLFGLKEFYIQDPKARNFLNEWVFTKILTEENIISTRYDFVDVTINDRHMGIYTLGEHFDKILLANNQRREGPILRFNEDLHFQELLQQQWSGVFPKLVKANGTGTYLASDIEPFNTKEILDNPALEKMFTRGKSLLESFRIGELTTSQVFDVDKMAAYFALTDLTSSQHGRWWRNIRFYYNPVTDKLEPIGYDGNSWEKITAISADEVDKGIGRFDDRFYYQNLFADKKFWTKYTQNLERFSKKNYLDGFFKKIDIELKEKLKIIYSDYHNYSFSSAIFYSNQRYLKTVLDPVRGVQAYFSQVQPGKLELTVANIQQLPVEISGISYKKREFKVVDGLAWLDPKVADVTPEFKKIQFVLPPDVTWSEELLTDLEINYQIAGLSKNRQDFVLPYLYLPDNFIESALANKQSTLADFGFLIIDEQTKEIFIRPGLWQIHKNLIVPKGYTLMANSGTTLNLTGGASIISYSAVEFRGSKEEPIIIKSSDGTGRGLAIINAGGLSLLDKVIFDNLAPPEQGRWNLTGAVTFYQSPVDIFNSQFQNNSAGDDALNIISSRFKMDNVHFSNTLADALDVDFSQGTIINSSFIKCGLANSGGDCLDFSNSLVNLRDLNINEAGDKGISVGENSQITAENLIIKNARFGAVSKDLSVFTLNKSTIEGAEIALAVYVKKPEFGPASLTATGLKTKNNKTEFWLEKESSLTINGAAKKANKEGVADLLYPQK
ncbi:MAG: CotH kinase family protein [Candidatus Komeilibacteria bacterium]|nr:CotH kinase family protein [Candidatus Komeilibacteria bacterium]